MQELRDKTTASLAEEKKQQEEILRLNGSLESKRAEIQRIETKLSTYEEESDQIHKDSAGLKLAKLATESASKEYDYLTQRVQVLEKKLDEAERALKEARDKQVAFSFSLLVSNGSVDSEMSTPKLSTLRDNWTRPRTI